MAIAVVIPTNRPEQFKLWWDSWKDYLSTRVSEIVVLWDGDNKHKDLLRPLNLYTVEGVLVKDLEVNMYVYDWKDIDKDLGIESWIIPRRSDTIRSYGFLKAWEQGYDVWTMDDDVRLIEFSDPLMHYRFDWPLHDNVGYYSVGEHVNAETEMRGYPYQYRQVPTCVQYGGWTNVPDFDALKQIEFVGQSGFEFHGFESVPRHLGVTGCIMNAYIPHRWIPAMYQLLMGHEEYGVDRNGDIWSGLFMKRVADELREAVIINGAASVEHIRASNPWASLIREASGFESNEGLWEALVRWEILAEDKTVLNCYRDLADFAAVYYEWPGMQEKWVKALPIAMRTWCDILERRAVEEV